MVKQTKIVKSLIVMTLLFLVLLLAGCATNAVAQTQQQPTQIANMKPVQWEYKVITLHDQMVGAFHNENAKLEEAGKTGSLVEDSVNPILQARLNKLGEEGWELVSFTGGADDVSTVMIFKRLKN